MPYVNGRLPDNVLSPIARGRLRKDAALRWNAMNIASRAKYGVTIIPLGGMSSYRTLSQQIYLWNHVAHPHDTNWVARPGTSNHGWGLAVDLGSHQMRSIVDAIGAKFGYAKKWSDAPGEWWHIKWAGFGIVAPRNLYPTIRKGAKDSDAIKRLQVYLRKKGYLPAKWHVHRSYTLAVRRAVRKFQKNHGLPVDGIVGLKTWSYLRK